MPTATSPRRSPSTERRRATAPCRTLTRASFPHAGAVERLVPCWRLGRAHVFAYFRAHLERTRPRAAASSSAAVTTGSNRRARLRPFYGVDLDNLLLDLHGDVRYDVVVEPGVVLLLRLPDLGNAKALGVLERDVEHEPRLL